MHTALERFKKGLAWFDEHALFLVACFLVVFVPLYPKIPLWSPIEQYIVRVRLEDIFILLGALLYAVQMLRGKAKWRSPMFWGVLAYGVVGLLSTLSALFYTQTVPLQALHVGKTVLHYFRYLEYFSLFFICFGAIKKRSHVVWLLTLFAASVLAVTIYGYGQKYYYWPVYSTMNREFSKGIRLYLTQYARVQSTFAGHYDMSAWLVIALPTLLGMAYQVRTKWKKWALHLTFWLGSWLLILSASRTPFAAGLAGIMLVIFISGAIKRDWVSRFSFWASRGAITLFFMSILFYYFGADLSERLSQVVNANPTLSKQVESLTNWRRTWLSDEQLAMVPLSPARLQELLPRSTPPNGAVSTDQAAAELAAAMQAAKDVASSSDQPPTPAGQPEPTPKVTVPPIFKAPDLPAGVYEDIPDEVQVTTKTETGETVTKTIKRPRVYSKCALEKELSLCIRLETLWPRAIEGFLMNPALGTGYATLTKESVDVFTEADSTDNNYLRTLGETGLLGFITFYGCVVVVLIAGLLNIRNKDTLASAFSIGLVGGTIGLLLNAVYIDVFAASKVAQSYWAMSGVLMGYLWLNRQSKVAMAPAVNVASKQPATKKGSKKRVKKTTR